jgi:hypothetical protein
MKRKVIPVARIVSSEICMAMRRTLSSVKNVCGRAMERTTKSPIAAARMPNSRMCRSRRHPNRSPASAVPSRARSSTAVVCAI